MAVTVTDTFDQDANFAAETYLAAFINVIYGARTELLFMAFIFAAWMARRAVTMTPERNHLKKYGKSQTKKAQPGGSASQWRDPAFVLVQLKLVQDSRCLEVYKTAVAAGFQLTQIRGEDERNDIMLQLVIAAVRCSRREDALRIFKDARDCGLTISEKLVTSVVKICASRSLFHDCLAIYDYVAEDPSFELTERTAWSSLLYCALEANQNKRCLEFFEKLKQYGMPSAKDFGAMVRVAQSDRDWQLALRLLRSLPERGVENTAHIHNSVLSICVEQGELEEAFKLLKEMERKGNGTADTITYNVLMKGYAKAGDIERCTQTYERMRQHGAKASSVTQGILLDGVISGSEPNNVGRIFDLILRDGCQMNTVLCTTLIKGFTRAGEMARAMDVYDMMKKDSNTLPDMVTYATLIKGNCDTNRLDLALKLLEEMQQAGLKPDEVVYNSLFSGCRFNGNVALCKKLYADMVSSGTKPTQAIFSNLVCLHAESRCLGDAIDMLAREPAIHEVVPAQRVFMQLISCCIRERQGRRTVRAYELMVKHSVPQADAHHSILGLCTRLNMFDTASGIVAVAAKRGAPIDRADLKLVMEAADKKQKAHQVECIREYYETGKIVEKRT